MFVVLAIVALVLTVLFGTLVTVLVVTYVWAPDAGHRRRARDMAAILLSRGGLRVQIGPVVAQVGGSGAPAGGEDLAAVYLLEPETPLMPGSNVDAGRKEGAMG